MLRFIVDVCNILLLHVAALHVACFMFYCSCNNRLTLIDSFRSRERKFLGAKVPAFEISQGTVRQQNCCVVRRFTETFSSAFTRMQK